MRVYNEGTYTIKAPTNVTITAIEFVLSTQGLQRQGKITASTGTVATQSSGNNIKWSGSASEITFTVVTGNAIYSNNGSDSSKSQLCFKNIKLSYTGDAGTVDPVDPVDPTPSANAPALSFSLLSPADATMTNSSAYNKTLTLTKTDNSASWTVYGFSNYGNQWNSSNAPMRTGTKTAANVVNSYIATNAAIPAMVDKVEVDIYRVKNGTNDKCSDIKLVVSDNSDFSNATEYAFDLTDFPSTLDGTGTISVDIPSAAANKYYKVLFTLATAKNNGWLGVQAVRYYGEVAEGTVAAPVISCTDNTVTISAENGATVYYTTDTTEPTAASTLYNGPFAISATTTVMAIAVKDGKSSAVATFTANYIGTYGSFSELTALGKDATGIVTGPLTVLYQNGDNLYLKDNSTNDDNCMLVYGTAPSKNLTNGVTFESLKATVSDYLGTVQYTPVEFGAQATGATVDPAELGIDEISANMLYKYVKLTGVNVTGAETASGKKQSFTITDANDETLTLVGRNNFAITFDNLENCTVIGFVNLYKNTDLQFYPISVEGGTIIERVEAPIITPESGAALNVGDEIAITCATEGATIHYTLDDSEPTASSPTYNSTPLIYDGVFTTVKAIAVKDGMIDSPVATATYSLYVEGEHTATFDFTSLETYNEMSSVAQDAIPAAGKGITITDNVFTAFPLSLSFVNESGDAPKWWNYSGKLELRVYAANTTTIKTTDKNFVITKISFEQNTGSTQFDTPSFTTNIDGVTGIWAHNTKTWSTDATTVNTVNMTGTKARASKINVTYVENPDVAGIEGIEADGNNSDAPVEYFNIQGIRVNADNLTPGFYIRRQGNKVAKIYVK